MNNFEGVQKAYTLAMNSAGSATEENARYMESIQAHLQNLKATFQDFARNVFNEEFVKRILDTANALLEFVNTPFGQAATRITLLSTALFGLGGILKGYWKYFVQGSIVAKGIKAFISANTASFVGPGITGLEKFVTLAKSLPLAKLGAWGAALAVAAVGIKKAYGALEEYHKPAAEYTQDIEDANSQLETNKKRLDEINQMSWKDMTADIRKERDELIKENEELEKNIALLNEKQLKAAKRQTGEGYAVQDASGTYYGDEGYEKVASWLDIVMDKAREEGEISDSLRNSYQARLELAADQVEMLELLKANGVDLTDAEQHLIDTYYEAIRVMDLVDDAGQTLMDSYTAIANAGYLTEEQYKKLISLYPDLANGAERTADGYVVQKNALLDLMSAEQAQAAQASALVSSMIAEAQQSGATGQALYDLVAAQITASNTNLNFSQQIAALQALGYQAGLAAAQMNAVFGTNMSSADQVRNRERTIQAYMKQGMSRKQAEAKYLSETQRYLSWSIANTTSKVTSGGGGSYVPKSSGQSAAESARQAQIKALQAEKDQIQDTIDAINKKYDAEIDKLEEVNDELEDEIELQKILEEMAQAKASKKMVYKDGKFQYVEDIDAVAAAQVKLDEYNRKKALKDAKAAIEERRKIELKGYQDRLAIIEANINALQNGFSAELGAWDDYLAQLQAKIDEEWRLLNSRPSGSGGGGHTSTVLPSAPSGLHSSSADPNYKMSAAEAVARRNQGLANAEKANKASAAKKAAAAAAAGAAAGAAGKKKPTTTKKGGSSKRSSSTKYRGRHHAMGTMSADGGFALVGEQGPELRVLNQGDGILPANITRNLWAMATNPQLRMGGSGNISNTAVNVANVTLPNVRNAEEFVAGLKNLAYQRAYARG